jgi:DNA-binding MarR family transcriptional regulator
VQEEFRREGAHAADRHEVSEEAEPVSEQKPCDNSGVVAEIRLKDAAADEARPVSIELGATEVAALKRVLESFEDGHSKPEAARETDARKFAARIIFETRKARSRLFPASMFSDPAWDMLIALYIAEEAPAAADLARSISASVTTAMRWIEILETHKFIVREQSPTDRRAHAIRLTEQARNKLDSLLSDAVSKWP